MWYLTHITGDLSVCKKARIQQRIIHFFHQFPDVCFPAIPFIDIRNEQQGLLFPFDVITYGLRELIAVRHEYGSDLQAARQLCFFSRIQLMQFDVVQAHQLRPGTVQFQKNFHPCHGIDLNIPCTQSLPPQVHQSGIVAYVRMCQKNGIGQHSMFKCQPAVQEFHLFRQIRGSFYQIGLFICLIHYPQRYHLPGCIGVQPQAGTAGFFATGMR